MSTKVKCLLLDDELPGLTYLRMLCEQLPDVEVVRAFNDPMKFLEESRRLDFDLCIMDVEMPGLSGLEIAQLLRDKPVIFTTAYKEYAAEAFDLEAVDYIRKPIQKERLEKAIRKAAGRRSPQAKQFVQLNSNKGKVLLFFEHVLLLTTSETDKRDKLAFLDNGQQLILKNVSFNWLLSRLPQDQFCRVNKKEIIALRAVNFFTHDEITTTITTAGNERLKVTLSDIYRQDFIAKTTK